MRCLCGCSPWFPMAFPNPSTASWPTDQPEWWFNGNPLTSGEDTKELTFDTEGAHSLQVRCGAYDGKLYMIDVIVPAPDQVSFVDWSDDEEHDIHDITDPVWKRVDSPDDPASYTKDNYINVNAKFWESIDLTFPTEVHVDVEMLENGWPFILDNDVTFQSWPSETTEHGSNNKLLNEICILGFNLKWKYKVPSGTNEWIEMSNTSGVHYLYCVYGPPKCGGSHYTEDNLDDAVGLAWGGTTEAVIASQCNDNVAGGVFRDPVGCICENGFQKNFDAAMGEYPTSGAKGMCCCRAEGLNCVLQVLGIGPYTHVYVNERPEPGVKGDSYDDYCPTCGKTVYRAYWAAGFWNNWEGAVRAGGAGTTCYAPAGLSGGYDEGTYSGFQTKIANDYGYSWVYSPGGETDVCTHLGPP